MNKTAKQQKHMLAHDSLVSDMRITSWWMTVLNTRRDNMPPGSTTGTTTTTSDAREEMSLEVPLSSAVILSTFLQEHSPEILDLPGMTDLMEFLCPGPSPNSNKPDDMAMWQPSSGTRWKSGGCCPTSASCPGWPGEMNSSYLWGRYWLTAGTKASLGLLSWPRIVHAVARPGKEPSPPRWAIGGHRGSAGRTPMSVMPMAKRKSAGIDF
ncbi:uncharacterized protein LOC106966547 [Acinonyx jubatus]|uniref:Uncharacterized protein LOC106966547 n=1 Tax=Acinonyx jubatus TaxID=32536 RepID=A0ABM3PL19_ACIJB|nr:uncharacterized protein LOC106966547 [Acinonyx jubatus]